jgi:hypothetical protein
MVDLMYIKFILVLNYILPSKTYDYIKYGGKVNATLDSFTKRKDRYFFHKLSTKYGQDDILDFFVANFLADRKRWIGNLLQTMVEKSIWLIKNVKRPLLTTLEVIAYVLMMTFALVAFVLMMVLFAIMDNILDFYSYLFKKRSGYKPQSCLTTSYRLLKIGIKKLKKLLYGLKSHLRLPE